MSTDVPYPNGLGVRVGYIEKALNRVETRVDRLEDEDQQKVLVEQIKGIRAELHGVREDVAEIKSFAKWITGAVIATGALVVAIAGVLIQ